MGHVLIHSCFRVSVEKKFKYKNGWQMIFYSQISIFSEDQPEIHVRFDKNSVNNTSWFIPTPFQLD